ncbi:MAG: TonB-dependent receptor [Bacteroidetes bacterium]|nr:TonB-dependent receptor [Bacteroidota bacterium]
MKYPLYKCILLLLLLPIFGVAQESRIQILDNINKEPVAFANAVLTPLKNNTILAGYISDINGVILANVEQKSILKLTYIGFLDHVDTILPGENKTIYLRMASYNVDEIVVTGQYDESRQDKSVYKVKVINSREIQNRGAVNLKEMLSTELNIRTSQDNALGSSITMQGLGGEHVKFLIDGVPVIGREAGNIDMDQLNLQNIDHIEIINGPMSVAYGSNALAGVINIITKPPDRLLFSSTLDAYYESVGVYNLNLAASGRAKRNSFGITAGRNFFDGYQAPGTSWGQRWKPKEQYNFSADYKYDWDNAHFKVGATYFNQELRDNGKLQAPWYETRIDTYFFTQRIVLRSDFKYKFNDRSRINAIASFSDYHKIRSTYYNDLTVLEQYPITDQQDTTEFRDVLLRADYSFGNENSKVKFQSGIDLNNETGTGKRITNSKQEIGDYAAFASMNYTPIPVLNIQPGLRFIYNTKFEAPIVYSLNVKYDLSEFVSVRGSIASGFRAPSLKELYLNFVDINHDIHGNENLKAETSVSTNIFVQYNSSPYQAYVWGLEMNLFNNNIKDNIQLIPLSGNTLYYTYVNVNRFITRGIELNFNNNVYPWLTVKFGYTITGQKIDYEGLESSKFEFYTGFNTTATYSLKKWDMNLSLFYKYNGKYPQLYFVEVGKPLDIEIMEAYNTMDITLDKWFWKRRINLQVGGKNLFNVTNINVVGGGSGGGIHSGSGPAPVNWGRTFFIRLQFKFNK